jgi:hypothetical protein
MNPQVAPLIHRYPQDMEGGPISELHQVPAPHGRWFEIGQDLLPPSVLVAHKRFYIHELTELDDGC